MSSLPPCFVEPSPSFRPQPFYVWNDDVTEEQLTEDLEWFAAQGFGGVFHHPRAGLVTEYLSPRWFELWAHALHECRRLGLECHIYDENSYPSGFAGGHTIAHNPLCALQFLTGRWVSDPADRPGFRNGGRLAVFRRGPAGLEPASEAAIRDALPEAPVFVCELRRPEANNWTAGLGYVDLCRPQSTEQFLALTHEKYAQHFGGDFGGAIRYAFADEPDIGFGGRGFNFSRFLQREFRFEHGYELADHLEALCFSTADSFRVRHDYFRTANRLFVTHYARKCHDWCAEHGIAFTGHFMEHQWPSPIGSPSSMAVLRWMQAPGSDLLAFQFSATTLAANALYLMNLKEVASVARQIGRERVLSETNGGGGYAFCARDMKRLEDFAMALGVNLVNPHLAHQTTVGSRKYDWGQTISPHVPWADSLPAHTAHVGRTAALMTFATERNRVLVLHPTTTGWLHFRPRSFHLDGEDADAPLRALREEQSGLCTDLYAAQIDFDLGDEFILEELGDVRDGRLVCGEGRYDVVVIPSGTGNLLPETVDLLARWLESGGRVLSSVTLPAWIAGRPDARVVELAAAHPTRWETFAERAALIARLRELTPPDVSTPDGSALPTGVAWRRQQLPDGRRVVFLANVFAEPWASSVRVTGRGVLKLDTATGSAAPLSVETLDADVTFPLALAPGEHALLLVGDEPLAAPAPPPRADQPVTVECQDAHRPAPNVLVLDFCDYETEGLALKDVSTFVADRDNWIAQGFDQNPWQFSIQFRHTVVDYPVDPASWFRVSYRWELAPELAGAPLEVAIEQPELYAITVNGHPLAASSGVRWFDRHTRRLAIGALTHPGENVLTLEARPFHVRAEIAPVMLLGEFSLEPAARGFRVVPPVVPDLGDWTRQGAPFYADRLRYRFRFTLPKTAAALAVRVGDWAGSAIRAEVDDNPVGVRVEPAASWQIPGPFAAGPHSLVLEVAGHLKNQLGPHHNPHLPHPSSWEHGAPHLPPGDRYLLTPSGLNGGVEVAFRPGD